MKLNIIFTRHPLRDDMKSAMRPDVHVLDLSHIAAKEIEERDDIYDIITEIDTSIAEYWRGLRDGEDPAVTAALATREEQEDYHLALFNDIEMYGVFPAVLVAGFYNTMAGEIWNCDDNNEWVKKHNLEDSQLEIHRKTLALYGFWNGRDWNDPFEFKGWVNLAVINKVTAEAFNLQRDWEESPWIREPKTAELELA